MQESDQANPYHATLHAIRSSRGGAGCRIWIAFFIRRLLYQIAIPGPIGALAAGLHPPQLDTGYVFVGVFGALFFAVLLSTVLQTWWRFLAPRRDPHGIMLATGERFDRNAFLAWTALRLGESAVAGLTIFTFPLIFYQNIWLWPFFAGVALLSIWRWGTLHLQWSVVRSLVDFAGYHYESAKQRAIPVANSRWIHRRVRDTAKWIIASSELRLGQIDAARRTTATIQFSRLKEPLQAQIAFIDGDLQPLRRWIETAPRKTWGDRFGQVSHETLLDIAEQNGKHLLQRSESWDSLRSAGTDSVHQLLDLCMAFGHGLNGNIEHAQGITTRLTDLNHFRWLPEVFPQTRSVWNAIVPAEFRYVKLD